ncbi:hypothetical protein Hdeb2414_s0009g00327521 [Helianthus debilis subsp. tardiflorus]
MIKLIILSSVGKHLNKLNIKIYRFGMLLKLIGLVRLFLVIENDYPKTEPEFSVIKNPKTEPPVFVSVRFFRSGFFGYLGYGSVILVFCSPLVVFVVGGMGRFLSVVA